MNVTTNLALVYNFIFTEGDKKAARLPPTQEIFQPIDIL